MENPIHDEIAETLLTLDNSPGPSNDGNRHIKINDLKIA